MRTIKFRGKRVDNGEWVYGNLINSYTDSDPLNESSEITVNICIQEFPIDYNKSRLTIVIPETVGQFTGLTDKNGKEIFDGDVLLSESWAINSKPKSKYHIVVWYNNKWAASGFNGQIRVNPEIGIKQDWKVIGNIHDNPELLK